MPIPARPTPIQIAFANAGAKAAIPIAPAGGPRASYTEGFPAITMQPVASGGQPPFGTDFNGILNALSAHILWMNSGGQYAFDATWAAATGGYPVGAILLNNAGTGSYINTVAGNTTDFNSSPSSIGVSWLPYAGDASFAVSIATTGGNTVLTAKQMRARQITITGALTSSATITIPNGVIGEWEFLNFTTGAFLTVTVVCNGIGVVVRQDSSGSSADKLFSTGTGVYYPSTSAATRSANDNSQWLANTAYVDRAVSQVGGFYQDTGSTANAYIVTTVPTSNSYVDGQTIRFRTSRANTGSATLNAGAGAATISQEDGGPLQAGDIPVGSINTVTYVSSTNLWVYNGTVASDFLDSPALRNTPTAPTPTAGDNSTRIATTAFVQGEIASQSANSALYQMGLIF